MFQNQWAFQKHVKEGIVEFVEVTSQELARVKNLRLEGFGALPAELKELKGLFRA